MKEIMDVYSSEIKEIRSTNQDMRNILIVVIRNQKDVQLIRNRELHMLKML